MQELETLRQQINTLDNDLVKLLSQRAQCALQIGQCKNDRGVFDFKDTGREEMVIDRICHLNPGPLSNDSLASIFRSIMCACLELQQNTHKE